MADIKVGDRVRIEATVTHVWDDSNDDVLQIDVKTPAGRELYCYAAHATLVPPEPVTTLHTASCGHGVNYRTAVRAGEETYCAECAGKRIAGLNRALACLGNEVDAMRRERRDESSHD